MKKAKIIKGKKPKANDSYDSFEDELTLAELIQNAAARGLTSVRAMLYGKSTEYGDTVAIEVNTTEEGIVRVKGGTRENPPKGATCACALGAMALTPKLTKPLSISAMNGNDNSDGDKIHIEGDTWDEDKHEYVFAYDDVRSMQIGVAYEQALRPD